MEPSVIQYARLYGLARDYHEVDPLRVLQSSFVLSNDSPLHLPDDIALAIGDNGKPPSERLRVNSETLAYLKSSIECPADIEADASHTLMPQSRQFRGFKLELPLLPTDPEHDIRKFKQRIEPDLANENIPLESIDEEAGEGVTWPAEDYQHLQELWRQIRTERFSIPFEGLRYLKSCMQAPPAAECADDCWIDNRKTFHERLLDSCPVSPPLLPISPEILPYEPCSEAAQLEAWSPLKSPLWEVIEEAEKEIFKNDRILPKSVDSERRNDPTSSSDTIGDFFSPLRSSGHQRCSHSPERSTRPDFKVEVPLSPAISDKALPWTTKNVSFAVNLEEIIPDLPLLPGLSDTGLAEENAELFAGKLATMAKEAMLQIEHEQLTDNDAFHRVRVPVLDFARFAAPWDTLAKDSASRRNAIGDAGELLEVAALTAAEIKRHLWRPNPRVEQALTWVPFPAALGNTERLESIEDDDHVILYIEAPIGIDSSTLMWKPEGLRILDNHEDFDGEETEEGTFPDENQLTSLLRKRRLSLEEREADIANGETKRHRLEKQAEGPGLLGDANLIGSCLDDSTGTNMDSLAIFLRYRTGKLDHLQAPKPVAAPPLTTAKNVNGALDQHQDTIDESSKPSNLPLPTISLLEEPQSFIVSTSFLLNRPLKNCFTSLYPTATLIERTLSLLNPTPTNHTTEPDHDADIIISPSTALLTTTLQKIKQRALPGSETKPNSPLSALQSRILHTSQQYERLFALLSQNIIQSGEHVVAGRTPDLVPSDCEAIAEFTSFCTGLKNGVTVLFIAGGVEQLARWIVSLIFKYSVSTSSVLTMEETSEEKFLRSAGLNSFAAQVVVAKIREKGVKGLGPFLMSTREQKVVLFERLLGGRKGLDRLQDVVEARW